MATVPLDRRTKVSWYAGLDSIADITQATVAELSDELVLERAITPDGLNITPTTGKRDTSNLGSDFTTNSNGRRSFDSSLKIHRQSVTDDEIADALVFNADGYLAVRRGIDRDIPWAVGQPYKIYPMECGEPGEPQSGAEQNWDYNVPMTITDDPCTTGIVVA